MMGTNIDRVILSYFVILFLCSDSSRSSVINRRQDRKECSEIPETMLEEILGASFNPRYMSISEPVATSNTKSGSKRTPVGDVDFFVDESHFEQLADEPAWEIRNHVKISQVVSSSRRVKRQTNYLQEWHCESEIIWKDLGPDYFPRYLRTVECTSQKCWFNTYKCKPRSFTVKILRRKKNRCVFSEPGKRIGLSGLPKDLRQLWVWEEHAVNFCCDCSL
ncbi:hypothetical protein HHI36_012796 [Cryptolaemus montrouzieri]|uniref:Uncharacterized protein n=1 Tax=Cryptolaemus montrouzieri TaxID=559131 RepID=A0ABD2NFJ1_9CUCU